KKPITGYVPATASRYQVGGGENTGCANRHIHELYSDSSSDGRWPSSCGNGVIAWRTAPTPTATNSAISVPRNSRTTDSEYRTPVRRSYRRRLRLSIVYPGLGAGRRRRAVL